MRINNITPNSNNPSFSDFQRLVAALEANEISSTVSGRTTSAHEIKAFWEKLTPQNEAGLAPKIGHFILGKELGRGGYGVVCIATDTATGREVALKLPHPHTLANPDSNRRFIREAEIVALLDHPNIVQVYEASEAGALAYIASALVEGPTLRDWLATNGLPNFPLVARIVAHVADGVGHAHDRGILHRDIKPGNILLAAPGDPINPQPKLTDFGLARSLDSDDDISQSGQTIGTATYMSPEQATGRRRDVDVRSDVWSLGAVLYEMLTGQPPFVGEGQAEIRLKVIQEEVLPPSKIRPGIPADLEAVCLKCLEKNANRRYGRAGDFADDLRRWLAGEPTTARPPGPVRRVTLAIRKHPYVSTLSIVACLVMVGFVSALIYHQATLTLINETLKDQQTIIIDKNNQLRRKVYVEGFKNASNLELKGQRRALIELLESHIPGKDESDFRGWEWYYYWALTHPEPTLMGKHDGMVNKIRFHPDGKTLISLGRDGYIKIYDALTGVAGPEWKVHSEEANDAIWSRDGKTLAVSSDKEGVALLDWPSGKRQKTLQTKQGIIFDLMFIPDEPFLLGNTETRPVVWDLNTGEEGFPGGPWFVHPIKLDVSNMDPENSTVMLGLKKDVIHLIPVRVDKTKVGLKRVEFGRGYGPYRPLDELDFALKSLEPLPGHIGMFSYREGSIGYYQSGREKFRIPVNDVRSLGATSDGNTIYAGTSDGKLVTVKLDVRSIGPSLMGEEQRITAIAVSKIYQSLVTASEDGGVRLYRDPQPTLQYEMRNAGNRGMPSLAPLTTCMALVVANNFEQSIVIWDYAKQKTLAELKLTDSIRRRKLDMRNPVWISVHPSGQRLMVGHYESPEYDEYSLPELTYLRTLQGSATELKRQSGKYSPDGRWFACGCGTNVELWDLTDTPKRRLIAGGRTPVGAIAFHPNSGRLVWCKDDKELRIHIPETGEDEPSIRLAGSFSIDFMSFSPDGTKLVAASESQKIEVWSWSERKRLYSLADFDSLISISFTPDQRRLVTCGFKSIRFWDLDSGVEIWTLPGQYPEDLDWRNVQFDPNDSAMYAVGTNRDGNGGVYVFPVAKK